MMITDRLIASARWPKGVKELLCERPDLAIAVVAQVVSAQREKATLLELYELPELLHVRIAAARGQGHDGAFLEGLKAKVMCDQRVEHADRIEESPPREALEPVAAADVGAGRRHVTVAVMTNTAASSNGDVKKMAACAS